MSARKPSFQKTTTTVSQELNDTAYDNVKIVSTNIDDVTYLADNMTELLAVSGDAQPVLDAATAALASEQAAALSETNANNDAVQVAADLVATDLDTIATAADRVQTGLDVVATNADVVLTHADAVLTAQDSVDTNADKLATNADVVTTNADVATTNANVLLTAADVVSTSGDRVAIETIYDNFDDRYLGSFATEPTLDNDGQALLIGAIYFDTTLDNTKFYNGVTWENPELTSTSAAATATTKAGEASASAAAALSSEGLAEADKVQTGLDRIQVAADLAATHQDTLDTAADLASTNQDAIDTAADLVLTNADVVLTHADVVTTNQDTLDTAADVLLTNADVITTSGHAAQTTIDAGNTAQDALDTAADLLATNQDRLDTAADLVATNQDTIDTAADLVLTNADVVLTHADVLLTASDAAATAADLLATNQDTIDTAANLAATNQDTIDTAADRVQTGLDRVATGQDLAATAQDVIDTGANLAQTTLDRAATAADLVQTNQDTLDTAADLVATNQDVIDTANNLLATAQDVIDAGVAKDAAVVAQGLSEDARDAAAISADFVDDLVLGAFTTALEPATDNDGGVLQAGAIYYNTDLTQLKIWNGTIWDDAAFNTTGAVTSFNSREGAITLNATDINTALGFTAVELTKTNVDALLINASTVNSLTVETAVPPGAVFTDNDTVYDDTAISAAVALNTAKVSNVDHPLVETAVPVGAVFTDTDTVYDDAAVTGRLDTLELIDHDHSNKAVLDATTASYTTDEETKLSGIEPLAEVNLTDAETSTLMKDYSESLTNKTIVDSSNHIHANALQFTVYNATAGIITKGTPVTITEHGANGIEVAVTNQSTMVASGIASEDIAISGAGLAISTGEISGINTENYAEGMILYVNGGTLTNIEPTSGFSQPIAVVLKDAVDGIIQVLAAYPKQDAADVRFVNATSVEDKIGAMDAAIGLNTAKLTNVTTDLSTTYNTTQVTIVSSDGSDAVINEANSSTAGVISAADHDKLAGISAGATVDQDLSTLALKSSDQTIAATEALTISGTSITLTKGDATTDVIVIPDGVTDHTLLSNIGTNTHAQIDTHLGDTTTHFTEGSITLSTSQVTGLDTALGNKIETSLKGANSGLAELDGTGKVPSSQLPSFVDDVIAEADLTALDVLTFEDGKIYVAKDTNITYRWDGIGQVAATNLIAIGSDLALGETSSTAYRGDRGKTAYDHSQVTHDKSLVGLSNVDNTSDANKPVSTAQQTALDDKVDDSQVLTDVPAGAVFTDTVTPVIDDLVSTTTTSALSANQGKELKTLVDGKQEALVSGTNIKTVNSTSLLGSGDIAIAGGATAIDDLSDVDTTSGHLSDNDLLVFDGSNWVHTDISPSTGDALIVGTHGWETTDRLTTAVVSVQESSVGTPILNIIALTQAEYDHLPSIATDTFYVIITDDPHH